eukprot:scaffold3013_cov113-Isochrysis_galbana.AAC.10
MSARAQHSATRARRTRTNGQRLGAILARLRAVPASTSAQQGRYPAGELTASTAQLDTRSALAQYSRQPANRTEGLAGTVPPPVALEVAARVAALRRILASDPGASPGDSDKGRAQPHDLESVAVSEPNLYTAPSNGADRVPDTHLHSPDSGQCQAPPSHLTADCGAVGPAESGALKGGALCASPPPYPYYPRSHNRSRSGVG